MSVTNGDGFQAVASLKRHGCFSHCALISTSSLSASNITSLQNKRFLSWIEDSTDVINRILSDGSNFFPHSSPWTILQYVTKCHDLFLQALPPALRLLQVSPSAVVIYAYLYALSKMTLERHNRTSSVGKRTWRRVRWSSVGTQWLPRSKGQIYKPRRD